MMTKMEIEEIAARAKQEPGQEDWILFDPDTVRHLSADLLAALKENEALRTALEFYADPASWEAPDNEHYPTACAVDVDEGAKARAALAGAGKEPTASLNLKEQHGDCDCAGCLPPTY